MPYHSSTHNDISTQRDSWFGSCNQCTPRCPASWAARQRDSDMLVWRPGKKNDRSNRFWPHNCLSSGVFIACIPYVVLTGTIPVKRVPLTRCEVQLLSCRRSGRSVRRQRPGLASDVKQTRRYVDLEKNILGSKKKPKSSYWNTFHKMTSKLLILIKLVLKPIIFQIILWVLQQIIFSIF